MVGKILSDQSHHEVRTEALKLVVTRAAVLDGHAHRFEDPPWINLDEGLERLEHMVGHRRMTHG